MDKCFIDNAENQSVVLNSNTLGELFRSKYCDEVNVEEFHKNDIKIIIPDYQRIYCWTEKNVYRLIDDIDSVYEKDEPYHLGSIILHLTKRDNDQVLAIVDGQQRLVTLAIICMFLNDDIKISLLDEHFESDEAISYIAYNKTLIKTYVDKLSSKKKETLLSFLLEKICLSVLIINEESLDLAYTFFSNQNSKGKSLTDFDLLKAHHLRFIFIEDQARHLAQRWDNILLNSQNDEQHNVKLNMVLGTYIFRLRKWMRKKVWNDVEKYKVKTEFEAAPIISEIPPFGEQFNFYESIQGGSHFFAYTDYFIFKYKIFIETKEFDALNKTLSKESHGWYREVIESLLFAYFIKFDKMYLSEALFCIEKIISQHRYSLGRSSLKSVLAHASDSEIVLMIDQSTSPTFFLAEIFNKVKNIPKREEFSGIRSRYYSLTKEIYNKIVDNFEIETIKTNLKNE